MLRKAIIIILASCLLSSLAMAAQTVYVTDKVLLGIYKEKSQNSQLLKTLPTATPLEILERSDDFARVRTPDGIEGWVDAAYLITDKPAQLQVLELTDKNRQAQAALEELKREVASLQKQVAGAKNGTARPAAGDDALRKLQQEKSALEKKLAGLEKQLAGSGDQQAQQAAAREAALARTEQQLAELQTQVKEHANERREVQGRLDQLRTEHTRLQQKVAAVVTTLGGQGVPASTGAADNAASPAPATVAAVPAGISLKWYLIGLALLALAGMAAGAWLMDRRYMKRHGGFRI